MSAFRKAVAGEVPGLALIQGGYEKGREIFCKNYLPVVEGYVTMAGLPDFNHGEFTAEDHAIVILGDFVTKPTEFFRRLDMPNDYAMRGYLRKMVVNRRNDLAKKEPVPGTRQDIVNEEREEIVPQDKVAIGWLAFRFPRPDFICSLREIVHLVDECLQELPPKVTLIIAMVAEGCSHEEMAEELRVNVKSVGVLVKRARDKLTAMLYERHPDLQPLTFR